MREERERRVTLAADARLLYVEQQVARHVPSKGDVMLGVLVAHIARRVHRRLVDNLVNRARLSEL